MAVALLADAAFGFLARPELTTGSHRAVPAAPSASAQLAPPGAAQVPIAVNPPPPATAAPHAPGRLATLPPEMAAAARGPVHAAAAEAAAENAAAQAAATGDTQAAAAPAAAPEPPLELQPPPAPAPQAHASFDCAAARAGAEQIVCSDPQLAAEDRQLSSAYRRALRAGADPVDLRQEQRDWMAIREDAARRSRQALAQVYDQRIEELNQIADQIAREQGEDFGDEPR